MKTILLTLMLAGSVSLLFSQPKDTLAKREFRKVDVFPAISYSPETQLTLGVIGYLYSDARRFHEDTRLSNLNFLGVYTTAKQVALELRWDRFSDGNRWRSNGRAIFNLWPDRNYGRGNEAAARLEVTEGEETEVRNYQPISYYRWQFNPTLLRQWAPNFYGGLALDVEYIHRLESTADRVKYLNAEAVALEGQAITGLSTGLGAQFIFETRDQVLNPMKGSFHQLGTLHYLEAFGGDFTFHSFLLDARRYLNVHRNHTLALRSVLNLRYASGEIPMRGLSRIGGRELVRGYFQGTYQDNHLLALEAEYRLPFWKEGVTAPLGQFWKRLGIVVFGSAAQVAPEVEAFSPDRFHYAAGAGLRVLFNKDSRVNLRIDYAFGLSPNSGGPGKRQSGLYFFLGEAF